MLAGGEQTLGDLPMKVVGHHDGDRVDVVGAGDGLPAGFRAFETVALGGLGGEGLVDVGDRDQIDRRCVAAEHRLGVAIGLGVGPAGHSGADHGDVDRISHVASLSKGGPGSAFAGMTPGRESSSGRGTGRAAHLQGRPDELLGGSGGGFEDPAEQRPGGPLSDLDAGVVDTGQPQVADLSE